ncbi:MAG: hypothetical protein IJX30_06755 [Clostridia bacterium]|nr:hypothetical protein [Clostridia bacterium]
MKRKSRISLLLSLMALASLFIFTGCKLGVTKQEILDRYDLSSCITYYVNADKATFEPIAATERNIYYKTGQTPYVIPESKISYENHIFDGWYEIQCDGNGAPIPVETFKDKDGNVTHSSYTLTQEADFSPMEEGEHRYYAAKWLTRTRVRVQLVLDDENAKVVIDKEKVSGDFFAPIQDKEEVAHGDEIMTFSYDGSSGTLPSFTAKLPVKDNSHTFVAYYADEACTTPVAWPIKEQEEDVYIYAKYITGKWTVINSTSGVTQLFNQIGSAKARFYLACDVDCSILAGGISAATKVACEIQGNGFALKNLTVTRNNGDGEVNKTSIFGQITETAVLNNIRFENLTFECKFNQKPDMQNYYYLFNSLDKAAKIENVTISGSMLMYNHDGVLLTNVKEGKNFIFGGYETDQAYLTETNGKGFSFTQTLVVETEKKSYA